MDKTLLIHLPDKQILSIGPGSEAEEISEKIMLSFATKENDWISSVLCINQGDKWLYIPYAMFKKGVAYWELRAG